jgi:hypothetical protein
MEKYYPKIGELRSIDLGHKGFKVLANTFELQRGKSREGNTGERREMSVCPIRARQRGLEFKV